MTGSYMGIRSSKALAFCIALAASVAGSRAARADDAAAPTAPSFALSGDALVVRGPSGETRVELGCTSRSFAAVRTFAYVLCAPNVVVVIDADPTPHVVERHVVTVRIEALFVDRGTVEAVTGTGVLPLAAYWKRHAHAPAGHRRRPAPFRAPEPPPRVEDLEARLSTTVGPGLDGPAGAFSLFDLSLVDRVGPAFLVGAYGTLGAATGAFDPGTSATGPRGGDVQVAVGEGVVGIDTRWVAFAFGAGGGLFEHGYEVQPLIVARGRVGPVDEIAFDWHASFGFSGPTLIGALGGTLEFRVTTRWWLGTEAELGNLRYGRFLVGLRHRLLGVGPAHVVDLRFAVGLAYVKSSADCNTALTGRGTPTGDTDCTGTNVDDLGPAASIGLVFRP
jgi:hypothetical protein